MDAGENYVTNSVFAQQLINKFINMNKLKFCVIQSVCERVSERLRERERTL